MTKFFGGGLDGKEIAVERVGGRLPLVFYAAHLMSFKQAADLRITDTMMWRSPEDVYYLEDGAYVFSHTVNYNPNVPK